MNERDEVLGFITQRGGVSKDDIYSQFADIPRGRVEGHLMVLGDHGLVWWDHGSPCLVRAKT